ncbi:MAG: hypothetical protein AB7K71_02620 [Polyangiaceae bacterium]
MERCAALRASLERLAAAKESRSKAEALEERRKELEKARIALATAVAPAQVLREHNHLSASSIPDVSKALDSCGAVQERLDADPTSITNGRDYKNLLTRLSEVAHALKTSVQSSWQSVVSEHQGPDEASLKRFEFFPGQKHTVQKIRELRQALEAETKQLPATAADYDRFQLAYGALQQELLKLDPEAFPEDVLRFFRAAQHANGAPIALFTSDVRDWLAANGWLDGVRVRFIGEGQR